MGTPVFQKRTDSLAMDENTCFSVIGKQQTLDLQAQTKEMTELWVKGLRRMIGHSDNKSDKLAKELESRQSQKLQRAQNYRKPYNANEQRELLQRDLFVMCTKTVFKTLEEEKIFDIDDFVRKLFSAKSLYEEAMAEDVHWRQWSAWIREKIVTYLRENDRCNG